MVLSREKERQNEKKRKETKRNEISMTFATSARGVTSIVTSARAITATARKTSVAATNVSASLLNDTYHERDSGSTTAIQKRWGHTVRLIAIEDLPHGKAYTGDVVHVKAGYARNYLIPQKMALYATPQNFERLGVVDPDLLLKQQKRRQDGGDGDDGTTPNLAAAAAAAVTDPAAKKAEKLMKDADLLRKYLKNKVVRSLFLFTFQNFPSFYFMFIFRFVRSLIHFADSLVAYLKL